MKKITLFSLLLISVFANAQKQANMWYFGNQAAMDFNSGAPVVLTNSAMYSFEGVSSIAHPGTGALLFYTNGEQVWNANHVTMPNGTGLQGSSASTQAVLIVEQPNNPNIYYLFTTDAFNGALGFKYHIVDMSLNGGLGDVTVKNQTLYTPTNERVTACTHANGTDVWIMSHQSIGDGFAAYLLTSTGLNMTPVISNSGPVLTGGNLDFLGYMKFSPQGNRLAIAESAPDNFWVFDFDPSTGAVSNPIQLVSANSFEGAYGVEFSPNGQVLYGTAEIPFLLYQWDLSSNNQATINASRITIPTATIGGSYIGSLQLGPDRKIYMTRNTSGWLSTINDPNVVGMGCNYVDSAVDLLGKQCVYGLPNLNQSYFTDFHIDDVCLGDSTHFYLDNTTGLLAASWDFGDPGSGVNNVSSIFTPAHLYTTPGTYTVTLIKYYLLYNDTLTINTNVYSYPTVNLGIDTSFCAGSTITLNAGGGFTDYLWQDGSTDSLFMVVDSGLYIVSVTNEICTSTDSVYLQMLQCQPIIAFASSDTSFCEKNCIDFYDMSTNNPISWQWFFPGADSTTSSLQNPTNICYNNYGSFDVTLIACNALGCDTLVFTNYINEYPSPVNVITGSNDTLYSLPFPSYQWYEVSSGLIPGANSQTYVITAQGSYYCVVVDSVGCIGTSNIIIVTGINQLNSQNGISLMPNPNNGNFEIVLKDELIPENCEIRIMNAMGQMVYQSSILNRKSTMSLMLSAGIYSVQLISDNKHFNQKMIVK